MLCRAADVMAESPLALVWCRRRFGRCVPAIVRLVACRDHSPLPPCFCVVLDPAKPHLCSELVAVSAVVACVEQVPASVCYVDTGRYVYQSVAFVIGHEITTSFLVRYSVADVSSVRSCCKNPMPRLHREHRMPLIFPVVASWSTASLCGSPVV